MPALTETVIYLLVVLIEVLQPTEAVTVDYLQNSAPAMAIEIVPVLDSDNDAYLVRASSALTDGDTLTLRIEQTDLYAHNYLVFAPGSPPAVFDLAPVRRSLAGMNLDPGAGRNADITLDLGTAGVSEETGGTVAPGQLHLLIRPPYIMLAAGAEAILLIAR